MENTPDNETEADSFEIDLVRVILKHRAGDKLSMLDTVGTIVNVLFTMATTQPNPKEAVDNLKTALDDVCKTWYEAGKPDVLKNLLVRCLVANAKAEGKELDELEPKKEL